jgi:TRAP-type transport system small permease protein
MNRLKKVALAIDDFIENFALVALTSMIIIVFIQVITRKVFNFVLFWSEEVTLLLMVWFSFMGIAIGFREKLHLAMDSVTKFFPKAVNRILDKIINICIFGFGLYFVVNGWAFTELMQGSTLPATKLPSSAMYVILPISGIMICIYSFLQLIGVQTERHHGIEETTPE